MKRLVITTLALCLALIVAAPAMGFETEMSGSYNVKGFANYNIGMTDEEANDSYMTMRFRLRTDFIITDNISLITRFDALDNKRYGSDDKNTGSRP